MLKAAVEKRDASVYPLTYDAMLIYRQKVARKMFQFFRNKQLLNTDLKAKPWIEADAKISKSIHKPRGMIGVEERQAYYWLARNYLSNQGCIVDAGCFVGASTFCFAAGAADAGRREFGGRPLIQAYDYFEAIDDYVAEAIRADFRPIEHNESYLDVFQMQTEFYADMISTHAGDFLTHKWSGMPIEILFIDLAKTAELNAHVIGEMFPSLQPGHSIIIQQDYYHCWHPYIHISMEFFADELELLDGYVKSQSRIWRLAKPLPEEKLARMRAYDLTAPERLGLLDRLIAGSSGDMRRMLEVVRFWQLYIDKEYERADREITPFIQANMSTANSALWARQVLEVKDHVDRMLEQA